MVNLSNLKPPVGSRKSPKRLGRGSGSGTGKTSGRGHKGQLSRSGGKSPAWREGGQMPLFRRLPKRGFTNIFRKEYQIVNLDDLARVDGPEITPEVLRKTGFARSGRKRIKILGRGGVDRPLTVKAHAFAGSARDKIVNAGGTCEVLA